MCATTSKLTATAAFLVAVFATATSAAAAGNEIVVGQIFDQSPAWIEAGRDYAGGAKTYFDQINSEGGVSGRRIVYVTRDTNGSLDQVKRAAEELINDAKTDVLFGTIGDPATRVLAELPAPGLQATPVFGSLTGLAFERNGMQTLRANYDEEARELVRHFIGVGLSSFCLVYSQSADQQSAILAARQAVAAATKAKPCEAGIDAAYSNAKSVADLVRSKQPQAVIVLGDTALAGNFARAFPFRQLGVLIGGLSLVNHTALMEIAGPLSAKGIVLTQVVPSPQREGVPIVREYVRAMKKFRDEPPSHLSLEGYIAAKAMIESMRTGLGAGLAPGRSLRREDVAAALLRGQARRVVNPAETDSGMTATKEGKTVDVTMLRGDGTLIR